MQHLFCRGPQGPAGCETACAEPAIRWVRRRFGEIAGPRAGVRGQRLAIATASVVKALFMHLAEPVARHLRLRQDHTALHARMRIRQCVFECRARKAREALRQEKPRPRPAQRRNRACRRLPAALPTNEAHAARRRRSHPGAGIVGRPCAAVCCGRPLCHPRARSRLRDGDYRPRR